jgi:hypothetical protein
MQTPAGRPAGFQKDALTNTTATPAFATAAGTSEAEPRAVSTSLLVRRSIDLAAPSFSRPDLLVGADSLLAQPAAPVSRWAAQVLAGPTLTHRQLGTAQASPWGPGYPVPSTSSTPYDFRTSRLVTQEKASMGFGVQVQVQRALTGRWSVSGGLGYQEYASQTTYPGWGSASLKSFNLSPQNINPYLPSYTRRDTYRFATVPVRVGYTLGPARERLRYGVVAGADAAWFLGGRSAGTGTAPTAWSSSGSPYRPLSLSISAGLDLRYRVASRLELMAQPTATRFLTSLPKSDSGLPARHLLGAGVLVGASYQLR